MIQITSVFTTLNSSPLTRLMADFEFSNSDLEKYSEYLGFKGIDSDVFYEMYYQIESEEFEELIEEHYANYNS